MSSRLVSAGRFVGVSCCRAGAWTGASNDFGGRRVLLIGVDGCRADALRKAVESGRAPAFRSLIEKGSVTWNGFTGGQLGGETEQDTWSGPGWTTIFTGVWRNKHGVFDNKFKRQRITEWPHFMRRLKDQV